ncbi:interleukin-13 [Trichechus manatus latirostris]|uniref:Interleukin-13 n=1 Tax=Trichechus manatus latirostris TaxID=127582 RepID=A0A2Y9RJZ5_TRIMA|nr:interleukin-13 [Trichechus manatus latirostris]
MALWLTVVIALTCVGGLASPVPVYYHHTKVLQELIGELINITQNQKTPLCNGSMVWSVNLTTTNYCAAVEALSNVSDCKAIQNTKRILSSACIQHKAPASQVSSLKVRDTKIELTSFIKNLLERLRNIFRHGPVN